MNKAHNFNSFGVTSVFAVVGQNPEMADFDNPRGDIVAEVFSVVAEAADGQRLRHEFKTLDREEACRLAGRVRDHVAAGGGLDRGRWYDEDPAYGSDAYIALGVEAHRRSRERFDDYGDAAERATGVQ